METRKEAGFNQQVTVFITKRLQCVRPYIVAIQFKCTYNQYRKLTVWHMTNFVHVVRYIRGLRETRKEAGFNQQVTVFIIRIDVAI